MNPDEIRAYACATCNGIGLTNDDTGTSAYQLAATCRDCDGTGIDNRN